MKDLLVGTSFAKDTKTQRKWLDTQINFIRETTEEFDHISVVNGQCWDDFGEGKTTLIRPVEQNYGGSRAHQQSLTILTDVFAGKANEYKNFLILDCDAFPIRKGWLQILNKKMGDHFEIATIIRPENCELRLHSSILFAKPRALENLNFVATEVGYRLDGYVEKDLNMPHYEKDREKVFVMARSNKKNVHPIGCGIYFDLFYHHSNGGDVPHIEKSKEYWDHMITPTEDLFDWRDMLFDTPSAFVKTLAWHTDSIPAVPGVPLNT